MKKLTRTGTIVVAGTATLALASGGVAFAYWTSSGTGGGQAKAGNTSAVTIAQTGTAITGLYPDGPVKNVDIAITNPDASDVTLAGVTATVDSITGAGAGGCVAGDFDVQSLYAGGVIPGGQTVPAPAAATIQMVDTGVNQDGCKNATVILKFTAS